MFRFNFSYLELERIILYLIRPIVQLNKEHLEPSILELQSFEYKNNIEESHIEFLGSLLIYNRNENCILGLNKAQLG